MAKAKKTETESKEDRLALARKRFERAIERDKENRDLYVKDSKFRAASPDHPEWQWEQADVNSRQNDPTGRRPCLVINKMPEHCNQVVNEGRQNKPSIKVLPVDGGADKETAEIFNGIVRHIENCSDAPTAYNTALDCAVAGGFGYFRILTEYYDDESLDQEIYIKRIRNPLTVVDDPDAQELDGSDRKWCFIIDELTKEEYEETYKDHPIDWSLAQEAYSGWWDEDKVRIAEYWYYETKTEEIKVGAKTRKVKRQKVHWQLINGKDVLEEREWAGKYIPIPRVSGNEYDIEGEVIRSGLVRNAKDAQRMYNYNASVEAETNALAPKSPIIAAVEATEGHETYWDNANRVNYSRLPYNAFTEGGNQIPAPQRAAPPMPQTAIIQAKMAANDDIKSTTGQYGASLGQQSNETSGKAIAARQRESDVSTFHYIDNLAKAIKFAGRIIVDLAPKIYDTERLVRILGEDGVADMVTLSPGAKMDKAKGIYDISAGKYDVAITVGPSYTTKRQEAGEAMIEATRAYPPLMQLAGDIIAETQDWPGSDRIAKRLKKAVPPQFQDEEEGEEIPAAAQAKMMQMQQENQQLTQALEEMMNNADAKKAEAEGAKAQADIVKSENESMESTAERELKREELGLEKDRLAFEREQFRAQQNAALLQAQQQGLEVDETGQAVPLVPMLQQIGQGMQAMFVALEQLAQGQQQLNDGLQQVAHIAAAPRKSTFITDENGQEAAVSHIVLQ